MGEVLEVPKVKDKGNFSFVVKIHNPINFEVEHLSNFLADTQDEQVTCIIIPQRLATV